MVHLATNILNKVKINKINKFLKTINYINLTLKIPPVQVAK